MIRKSHLVVVFPYVCGGIFNDVLNIVLNFAMISKSILFNFILKNTFIALYPLR